MFLNVMKIRSLRNLEEGSTFNYFHIAWHQRLTKIFINSQFLRNKSRKRKLKLFETFANPKTYCIIFKQEKHHQISNQHHNNHSSSNNHHHHHRHHNHNSKRQPNNISSHKKSPLQLIMNHLRIIHNILTIDIINTMTCIQLLTIPTIIPRPHITMRPMPSRITMILPASNIKITCTVPLIGHHRQQTTYRPHLPQHTLVHRSTSHPKAPPTDPAPIQCIRITFPHTPTIHRRHHPHLQQHPLIDPIGTARF